MADEIRGAYAQREARIKAAKEAAVRSRNAAAESVAVAVPEVAVAPAVPEVRPSVRPAVATPAPADNKAEVN